MNLVSHCFMSTTIIVLSCLLIQLLDLHGWYWVVNMNREIADLFEFSEVKVRQATIDLQLKLKLFEVIAAMTTLYNCELSLFSTHYTKKQII